MVHTSIRISYDTRDNGCMNPGALSPLVHWEVYLLDTIGKWFLK